MKSAITYSAVLLALLWEPAFSQTISSEYVQVGDYRIHVRIAEPEQYQDRLPVVVLEAGHGSDSRFWQDIQPQIATEFGIKVIAYDRAGMGRSDISDATYNISKDAQDLKAVLSSLGMDDSIVLVSHSYGGMISQVYAAMWPETVQAAVFLDPNTAAAYIAPYRRFLETIVYPEPQTPQQETAANAFYAIEDSLLTVYRDAPLPESLPIIVVSSESGIFQSERENEAFKLGHQLLAKSVSDGEWLIAEGTNHNIIDTRADIVIASIRTLLNSTAQP
jgi:pimeloyl-ACP methyl ester carboxylesterase